MSDSAPKRYAIVGVGARSWMFQDALFGPYRERAELVAICDRNPARLALTQTRAAQAGAPKPSAYAAETFDRMLVEARPHALIVTTIDAEHDDYVVRGLDAGCDIITEKPLTTTADKAQRILDACHAAQRHIRVAFNYRYSPSNTQLKQLLMAGEIGEVLSVDFNWLLDTSHGADYFRRWHSEKANSGGLMVHKATHHFDLVNWWLSALPVSVTARGRRAFYTEATARRMGLSGAHVRCLTCPEQAACPFYFDIAGDAKTKALYADAETHDGYFRDRCVWRDDIDIEDSMQVAVSYDTGVALSYSLTAFASGEGFQVAFNGTQGRLEHRLVEHYYAIDRVGDARLVPGSATTRVIPLRGPARDIEVWTGEGGHGGGDPLLLADLFDAKPAADPYRRAADERAGAWSMLVGAAANRSMAESRTIFVGDLVRDLDRPEYSLMPSDTNAIAPPPRTPWRP